ncbi:Glucoamylase (glucan-1,4-alpha-glucosidase), GH15 family [Agreia bicolorata]|uniref:Glucoamylase (Glucan-1,4-alpha-glucosidase), GH15 family n=1 Tax=Agreia bicolorata TaxID=110935 RepID=A0A1T4XXZ8_9MICO|nr:glycoside hydrolase family 15 protein [Agreia bicolorata]SKA93925.1 Glucoamylase (glucan-1,4-alpha-glucosidase), GH15 family [Agreia bicolorata]
MSLAIEDYALISDCHTAALVGRDGSIDWLCLPRYDSPSTFGALLGDEEHGRWLLAPTSPDATATRAYDGNSFILVTTWTTPTGVVEVTELMPHGDRRADVLRRVRCISGHVEMVEELVIRFVYATAVPWVRQSSENGHPMLVAIAGPDALVRRGPRLTAAGTRHRGVFAVREGSHVDISLTWFPSHRKPPHQLNFDERVVATKAWWAEWSKTLTHDGPYGPEVIRSLLVLRALSHEDTGGIVAAATTSLPESQSGVRNWDYRYVWLRDASLTLQVLLSHGFDNEAVNWRGWLLRAIAGDPADIQIMYGLAGERELPEREITSLPGYQGASPVRVGNGAALQYQADVIGEVMMALHEARVAGAEETEFSWPLQRSLMAFVEDNWTRPDNGIWEIRGEVQHFTHSRVMIWVALDRAVRGVREFGLDGPADTWEKLRDEVRAEIEENGWNAERGTYTQYYGSTEVDASLLLLPQTGFCTPTDARMLGTVKAIESDLLNDGLVMRYRTESDVDGLPAGEHPFLACSFWLAEQWAASGRLADAVTLMDRLVSFTNDVGLLSEEYDPAAGRQMGNTPQALSHLALVRAADAIARNSPPATDEN